MRKKKEEAVQTGGDSCACGCGGTCEHAADQVEIKADDAPASASTQPTVATPELIEAEQDARTDSEILAPLAMGRVCKIPRDQINLSSAFPIHSGQENNYESTLPPETFDVDSKMFIVWQNVDGDIILVDGHHHYRDAQAATHFVTSKFQKDRLVSCEAELLCRCIYEVDGWTMDLVRVLSERANFDGKKAITLTPEEQTATDSLLSKDFEVVVDCLLTDSRSFTILARDNKKNEIRVRQRATRWDSVNENNRIYPRHVGEKARAFADAWAKEGLMTSELEHPGVVRDCSNGVCEDKFAHNPKRQTAIVHRMFPADDSGWVDIERTIKGNTPCGKLVKDAFERGEPFGISTRFHVKGKEKLIDGRRILVADAMDILTFDDVENPAVLGAGSPSPVTDSILSFLTGDSATYGPAPPVLADAANLPNPEPSSTDDPYLGTPFFGTNNNTINPPNERYGEEPLEEALEKSFDQDSLNLRQQMHAQEEPKNMYDIPRLIADFKTNYGKPGGIPLNHTADGCKIVHAISDAKTKGDANWNAHLDSFKAAFDMSTMAGYRGGAIAVTVASEMGGEVGAGWGSEIETATGLNKLVHSGAMAKPEPHGEDGKKMGAGPDADAKTDTIIMHPSLKALVDEKEEKKAKKEMKAEFEKAAEDCEELKEDEAMMDSVWKLYKSVARPGTDAKAFIAAQVAILGKSKGDQVAIDRAALIPAEGVKGKVLNDKGTAGDQQGDRKGASVVHEYRPWAAGTEDFLKATDNMCRKMRGAAVDVEIADPDSPEVIKRRALNHKLLAPILEDHGKRRMQMAGDNRDFRLASDSKDDGKRLLQQSCQNLLKFDDRMVAAVDTTTTAVVLNQPSVSESQIVLGFQDLTALEFIMAMGPRGFNSTTGGFTRDAYPIGTNLRVPSIGYNNPSGWGYSDGFFDAGLKTPQNAGIQPGNTTVAWLNFGITPRKISAILTWEAIKQIGNGPGDISLLSWELYMMAARESRTIDNALYNEMVAVAYEFGAVAVPGEAYTVGNNLLVNNSVYSAAGPVVVNLNPQKKATAAVASGDMSVTYPVSPPAGTQQIIGAVRLLCGGQNTTNAAPYYGFYNGTGYPGTIGPGPIVRPRTTATLSDQFGNTTNVTTNPVTITAPGAAVLGELTSTGGIWSYPGTTATCAIDNENGILVFASGVTGGGTGITTNVTLTYSYATNWVDFVADPVLAAANSLIPTGITYEQYANGLFRIVDKVSAEMGSSTNYVKPDCALTNLIGSSYYTYAQLFAPLFSPPATELFPSPSAVAERSGVTFHRHNSSWVGRSQTLLLTRKGSTFYAQDTPFNIQGPVTVQDNNGNPTGNLAFYGLEFSVIGTRQPIDINNNVLNCPNKVVILRMLQQNIGVF